MPRGISNKIKICEICNKEVSSIKRRFCSNACKMKWITNKSKGKKAHNNKQLERICIWCGKKRLVAPAFVNRKYCNRKCMKEHYASGIMQGKNHWNWQGGITENEGRDSLYSGYNDWRRAVYKRDNFKCILCGNNKSGKLQAHHIKPVAMYKDLVLDISNGLTVCEKCHKEIHYKKI